MVIGQYSTQTFPDVENVQHSIAYPRSQHELCSNHPVVYHLVRHAFAQIHIIRAPDQDDMNQAHPRQQRYQAQQHYFVLAKQSVVPHHTSKQPYAYYREGKTRTPPTEQQGGIVRLSRARFRWGSRK